MDSLWPKRHLNPPEGNDRRWTKQLVFQKPSPSVSVWQSGNGRRWAEIRVRTLPWSVWLKTLKKGFNGDYGVKLTPNKLKALCEVDCFCCRIALEGSLDKPVVNEVYRVNVKIITVFYCYF
jgi:hypothetical protein